MDEDRRKLFSFGFRSGKNVLEGKKIRKHADGGDIFEDYFTDIDSEDNSGSLSDGCPPAAEAPVIAEVYVQARSPRKSLASVQARRSPYGFRSGRNVLEGKKIRKHANGADNFADYFTDADSSKDSSNSLGGKCPPAVEAPVISEASVKTRSSRNSLASVQTRSSRNSLASVQARSPRNSLASVQARKRISRNSVKKNVQNDNPNVPLPRNLVNKSISNTNLSASDIHVLSSIEVSSPKADLPDGTLSEALNFSDKTSNSNSSVGHNNSNISKISLESHTVINKRSLQMSKAFAKYDEYDAEIMQMANDNGNSLNIRRKNYSARPSCSIKQAEEKAKSNVSKNTNEKIMETTINVREAENSLNNLSSSKIKQSRNKSVSNNEKSGLTDISNTSHYTRKSPTKNLFSKSFKNLDILPETSGKNDNKKKSGIKSTVKQKFIKTCPDSPQKSLTGGDKNESANESCSETGDCSKVQAGDNFSNQDSYKNATKTDNSSNIQYNNEVEVETLSHTNQDSCMSHNSEIKDKVILSSDYSKKKHKTMENINLRSVTKGKDNYKIGTKIPKIAKQPAGSPIKNKKHVNKIHENVETSRTFSNENTENVIKSPVKRRDVPPSRDSRSQRVKVSETISNSNTEGDLFIPSTETSITDNHNSNKKSTNKTYEHLNPSEPDRENSKKRKQHVGESLPVTNQHALPSTKKKKLKEKVFNSTEEAAFDENAGTSKTFCNESTENVIESPVKSIDNSPRRVSRSQRAKVSETVSKGNTEGDIFIPSTKTGITDNHNNSRKSADKTYEYLNPSEPDRENSKKRKQHVSESLPVTNQHALPSTKKKKLTKKVINTTEEAAFDENAETSKTFSIENVIESPVTPSCVSRSQRAKASETVSNSNMVGDLFIPSTETGITDNHNSNRKSTNKNCENLNPSELDGYNSKKRKQHVSESSPFTNQHALPSRRKKKLKKRVINITEEAAFVRRSDRQKFPPLERWRNERFVYKFENGCPCVASVDKGFKVDDQAIQSILKRKLKQVKNKLKTRAPPKIEIKDVRLGKRVKLSLVKRFHTIPWEQDAKRPYCIKKIFSTNRSVYGIIEIKINEEKSVQYLPDEDIYFTVVRGKVQVTIDDSENEVSEMDMFAVPRSVPYSIKNIGTVKAVLNFCVGQFQYIESYLQKAK